MISFLIDENFNEAIIQGLLRCCPGTDLLRVKEIGLSGADDPTLLEWAAQSGRVLITHDVTTMTRFAYERVGAGLPMPGVIEVPDSIEFDQAIEDLALFAECSIEGEWEGQVRYIPL